MTLVEVIDATNGRTFIDLEQVRIVNYDTHFVTLYFDREHYIQASVEKNASLLETIDRARTT